MKLANQKLGMMRHLFILLDCSEYMTCPDLKPSRFLCTLKVCKFAYLKPMLLKGNNTNATREINMKWIICAMQSLNNLL